MMAIGAVVLHAAVVVLPGQSFAAATWTPSALGALACLSAVAGVSGFLLYFTLLDDLGPIEMSFIEYVIPVFAALAGWFVLGQEVTPATVVGFAFIVAGAARCINSTGHTGGTPRRATTERQSFSVGRFNGDAWQSEYLRGPPGTGEASVRALSERLAMSFAVDGLVSGSEYR